MAFYRSEADRVIDRAHHKICLAEMAINHSFTVEAKEAALKELAQAQSFLRRAVEAKQAWDAVEHDDYEEYPHVPETE